MQGSNLGLQTWALEIYFLTTNLKSIACTKLASDLKITQKSAWHLAMRIRETYHDNAPLLEGDVEIDETYIGGKEKNKHAYKKICEGRSPVGKKPVLGMKQRRGKIKTMPVEDTTIKTTHGFVFDSVAKGSQLYTDVARRWTGGVGGYRRQRVNHSSKEYVNGQAHTNGIESFWVLFKLGYHGTHHHMSEKFLRRYVCEFSCRHNDRKNDTINQMVSIASSMVGSQLRYKDLVV